MLKNPKKAYTYPHIFIRIKESQEGLKNPFLLQIGAKKIVLDMPSLYDISSFVDSVYHVVECLQQKFKNRQFDDAKLHKRLN